MSEKTKNELIEIWMAIKSVWKLIVAMVAIIVFASIVDKCFGQNINVHANMFIPMADGTNEIKVGVGGDLNIAIHYRVGAELTCAPGKEAKCGVTTYNAVGSDTDRWGLWVKGFVGAEHIFTDRATDHSYIVYGVGVKVTRYMEGFGLFVEPGLGWNTHSAYIGPSAERGWYIIRTGVSINIGK